MPPRRRKTNEHIDNTSSPLSQVSQAASGQPLSASPSQQPQLTPTQRPQSIPIPPLGFNLAQPGQPLAHMNSEAAARLQDLQRAIDASAAHIKGLRSQGRSQGDQELARSEQNHMQLVETMRQFTQRLLDASRFPQAQRQMQQQGGPPPVGMNGINLGPNETPLSLEQIQQRQKFAMQREMQRQIQQQFLSPQELQELNTVTTQGRELQQRVSQIDEYVNKNGGPGSAELRPILEERQRISEQFNIIKNKVRQLTERAHARKTSQTQQQMQMIGKPENQLSSPQSNSLPAANGGQSNFRPPTAVQPNPQIAAFPSTSPSPSKTSTPGQQITLPTSRTNSLFSSSQGPQGNQLQPPSTTFSISQYTKNSDPGPARASLSGGFAVGSSVLGTVPPGGKQLVASGSIARKVNTSLDTDWDPDIEPSSAPGGTTSAGSAGAGDSGGKSVLGKRKLWDLLATLHPPGSGPDEYETITLAPEVENILLELSDEFIYSVLNQSAKLARHRGSDKLEIKDVRFELEKGWDIRVPGFENVGEMIAAGAASGSVGRGKLNKLGVGYSGKIEAVKLAKSIGRD